MVVGPYRPEADVASQEEFMKLVHWISLCIALVGIAMLIAGVSKVGGFLILASTVGEIIYAAVAGKKSNAGTR